MATIDVKIMHECICYDIMHRFLKMVEYECSKELISFSANPTFWKRTLLGDFAGAPKSVLRHYKFDQHPDNHFYIQWETLTLIIRSWGRYWFKKILIRADDSDIFLGALQHREPRSETVIDKGQCGKNNRKQVNMNKLAEALGDDVCFV